MKNELTKTETGLVDALATNQLSDLIKPLIQKIYLFDSYVAGTTYLKDTSVLATLNVQDELRLQREMNKFDHNAIEIYTMQQQKIGYVPEKDNIVFARLMDAGKLLSATIQSIEKKNDFYSIRIGIYLTDY